MSDNARLIKEARNKVISEADKEKYLFEPEYHAWVTRCADAAEMGVRLATKQAEAELQAEKQKNERLREAILDIDAHATPFGDIPKEPGWVGTYLLTAGALHRALGLIGHSAARAALQDKETPS